MMLEGVSAHPYPALNFSSACKCLPVVVHARCMPVCLLSCFSHVRLFATPWTVAHQAPLSMGFPRQEYWVAFGRRLLTTGLLGKPRHLTFWSKRPRSEMKSNRETALSFEEINLPIQPCLPPPFFFFLSLFGRQPILILVAILLEYLGLE